MALSPIETGNDWTPLHDDNVEKIQNAPRPSNKKGLEEYYKDFIPNFAVISAPLSDLTRKG